jgi:hypothetical protein
LFKWKARERKKGQLQFWLQKRQVMWV